MVIRESEVLDYHDGGRPGKLEVIASKPCLTQRDLSLAYTPGVAIPCLRIEKDPDEAFRYTGRGNLVAVISNGTAVLGLGNIGALAGKPVMEGKGVLFKRFADVNVFDIEVATEDADELIRCVKLLEPTFGGINLEDIKAPECFHIEETLQREMDIPIFHDDQHGTAIISSAALLNALELTGKDISKIRVVFAGAGAAGIACANMYIALGVDPANVLMVDSKGVLYEGRDDAMNKYKQAYVRQTECRTIADALDGADVFVGVSSKDLVSQDMVRSMADNPIVFAMANPDPEITYPDAKAARPDVIMATGRSDYPNQVNNVLGFPFIFRGALDVRARAINMEMKLAAAHALAALAKEEVPDAVINAYGGERFSFGPDYIIPKPFDSRVLTWEAVAVAKAAVETGVARLPISDWDAYAEGLERRILGKAREVTRSLQNKARRVGLQRIVLPESGEEKILRAALTLADEHIARPVLVGDPEHIHNRADALGIDLHDTIEIVDPAARMEAYAQELYRLRERRGVTPHTARLMLQDPAYLGVMMLHMGDADGLVCGLNRSYPETIRPALQILKLRPGVTKVAGHVLRHRARPCAVLRGRHREHRAHGGGAGGDRRECGGHRSAVLRRRSPGRDAVVQQLRLGEPRIRPADGGGDPAGPQARARSGGGGRDGPRHGADTGDRGAELPALADPGRCERADLPQRAVGQHLPEAGAAARRRRSDRPRPHGSEQAGERVELLLQRCGDREYRHHHGHHGGWQRCPRRAAGRGFGDGASGARPRVAPGSAGSSPRRRPRTITRTSPRPSGAPGRSRPLYP
jgi:malate dehydrogenase (oxaloacetate-decarboxylating)(NADP+)